MNYDIYYKRSNKIEYIPGINVNAYNDTKDILVTLSSNPFITVINLNITGSELIKPFVKIYDLAGRLIKTIEEINYSGNSYSCLWTGVNETGNEVKAGSYIINIKMGKHVLNNLIVKE
jgi:flagellar hook assembly protein FlgD